MRKYTIIFLIANLYRGNYFLTLNNASNLYRSLGGFGKIWYGKIAGKSYFYNIPVSHLMSIISSYRFQNLPAPFMDKLSGDIEIYNPVMYRVCWWYMRNYREDDGYNVENSSRRRVIIILLLLTIVVLIIGLYSLVVIPIMTVRFLFLPVLSFRRRQNHFC